MLKRRILGSVAAGIAVAFVLAGCALIPEALGVAPAKPAAVVPKVGQCWNATNAQAAAWADWEGSASLSCSKAHVLYTYAVGKISDVTSKSWAKPGSPQTLTDEIQIKAEDACSVSSLIPKLKWNQELVQGFFFVPSEADWKAGARWIRCDVGVLSFGTTLDNEVLARMPSKISTLVSAVESEPVRYEFCVNTPVPVSEGGPLNNTSARIADCRQNPQWALSGRGNLPEAVGSTYPTGSTANADAAKVCEKFVLNTNEVWIAYLPDAAADGTVGINREVDCWIGQKSASGSAGNA